MTRPSVVQPLAIAENTGVARDSFEPGAAAVAAEPLLLIARDPIAARLIDGALGEAGFSVHCVPTGDQGLEYLAAHAVAGIVLEHGLPDAGGLQTLRRLREQQVASPVVMLAHAGSTELAVKAVKAGAFDFVAKHDDYLPSLVGKVREAVAELRTRATPQRVVRPVFVGREGEMRVLSEELARSASGEGRVVLVVGEEGIGKTSVALEISRRARGQAYTVLWGQCHDAGGAPAYWPWIQVVRSYVKTADLETLREDLGESAAAVGWITPTLRERCRDLPMADTTTLTRFHVVDGVTQFLQRIAAHRPLMLVFDDLHRADGDSLHLFRFLATESAHAPLLVVGTYRDGAADRPIARELAHVAGLPLTTVLRLGGFGIADVHRYVEEATSVRLSKRLTHAIHAKTEGHPLFVAEVTRLLATDGRLSGDRSCGDFRLAIPATRRQAVSDRLERLSGRCHRLLSVAAVIGYDFTAELISQVMGEEPSPVRDALEEGIHEQAVTVSDDEPGAYRFAHVLLRDVLYDSLAPSERVGLHERVAVELEAGWTRGGPAPLAAEPLVAAIAYHYLEAATAADDLERALGWVVAAGDSAAALMAHEEAARHYEVALSVVERARLATPTTTHDLLMKLAEARWRAGDMNGAREAGRRALILAKQAGEPAMMAAAALTFAGRLPGFGAVVSDAEVVSELEQALALLPSSAMALRAQVIARLAEELAYSPRRGAERALGQQAIDLARATGDPKVLAAVLRTTQWSVWTPDDVERRRQLASEIVALAERTGDRVLALDGELLRLWSALEHGETEAAWQQLELCTRLVSDLHLPHYAWVTAAGRACLHIATGRLDEAERLAEEAAQAGERTGNPTVALVVGGQRQHVRFLRGSFGEMGEWLQSLLTNLPVLASAVECWLIIMYARTGQHDRARAELAGFAADDFARVPRSLTWLTNMTSLAAACAATGDTETARRLYPHLAPFTPYNVVLPPIFVLGPVAHYVAGLAEVMGNDSAARQHYENALALEGRTGSRQWTARTQVAYGRLLRQSPSAADRDRGTRLIASGRTIAKELGLEPVLQEADAAVASPLPPATVRGVYRLVGNEWEIEFHGRRATVPHRLGMTYIRYLLERPGVPIAAIELASIGADASLVDRSGGPLVDRKAMAEVKHRLSEIEADIAACQRRGVVVSADLLHERAACAAYLGGRRSELVSAADRARSGVTKAIGRALKAIHDVHAELGYHLERHIETGRLCVYICDLVAPVSFEL